MSIADTSNYCRKVAARLVLGSERIDDPQDVFWHLLITGNDDQEDLWCETTYFHRNRLPIHLGPVAANDRGSNAADCWNSCCLPAGSSSEHYISTLLEKPSLVGEGALIIMDAKNRLRDRVIGHRLASSTARGSTM